MTLKIDRHTDEGWKILKLIGRIRSDDLEEIRSQMVVPGTCIAFDLKEVTLVDSDSVRFLGLCESEGVRLLDCALYIREWISRERQAETNPQRRAELGTK